MPLTTRGGKKNPDKSAARSRVDLKRTGLAVATIVILSVLLSIHMLPSKVTLKLGQISPEDIIAPRTARYKDTTETELRKAKAAAGVGKAYDVVPNAADQAIGALKTIFATVENVRGRSTGGPVTKRVDLVRQRLGSVIGGHVSDGTFVSLLSMDPAALRQVEDDSLQIVSAAMSREIHDDPADLRESRREVLAESERLLNDPRKAALVGEIAQDSLRPNRVFDPDRTVDQQEAAKDKVLPVYRLIMRGDTVIAKGEPVLQEHIEKFEALGLMNPKVDYWSVIWLTVLVMMAVLLVVGYLYRYYYDVYRDTRTLLLLAVLVVIGTLALRISGSLLGINLTPYQVGYLGILWVTAVGMLVAVLVNPQVSVLITALLSIVLSLMLNGELRFAASAFMTAVVGIYSVANIRDRSDLATSVGALAAAGVILVWVTGGLNNDPISLMQMGTVWVGLVVPIGAAALFYFGTVPLEKLFGLTTHISLLELANTNKPLLRKLVMEAPGTYTHSMAVGHLAETAAEAIGADSLMARVASYYHDIGKIRRPQFFIENQNVENVHDRMNPTLSALVITSHIKDGVDIAKEYRLPGVVIDAIMQHHGTSLVQYFYDQAAGEQDPCMALESQFRYGGPKPKTKEAAIVMLADSVEAASRAMPKPTRATIELVVNKVIADKLRDGQLDESDLSFKEVGTISEAFRRALMGTLHARIDYSEAENKRLAANGDSDSKLARDSGEDEADTEPGPTTTAS